MFDKYVVFIPSVQPPFVSSLNSSQPYFLFILLSGKKVNSSGTVSINSPTLASIRPSLYTLIVYTTLSPCSTLTGFDDLFIPNEYVASALSEFVPLFSNAVTSVTFSSLFWSSGIFFVVFVASVRLDKYFFSAKSYVIGITTSKS